MSFTLPRLGLRACFASFNVNVYYIYFILYYISVSYVGVLSILTVRLRPLPQETLSLYTHFDLA
jgi:hypothetical protein